MGNPFILNPIVLSSSHTVAQALRETSFSELKASQPELMILGGALKAAGISEADQFLKDVESLERADPQSADLVAIHKRFVSVIEGLRDRKVLWETVRVKALEQTARRFKPEAITSALSPLEKHRSQPIAKDGKIEGRIEVSAYVVIGYLLSEGSEDELQKVLLSRKHEGDEDVIDAENCRKLYKLFQERIEKLKKNPKLSPTEIELETFEGNPNPTFPNWLFSVAQFVTEDIGVAARQNKPLRLIQKSNFPSPQFESKSKEIALQGLLKNIPFLKDKIGEWESHLNGSIVDYNIGRPDRPIVLVYLDRHDKQEVQDAIEAGIAKTLGLGKAKTDVSLYQEGLVEPLLTDQAKCPPGWKEAMKKMQRMNPLDPDPTVVGAAWMLGCDYPGRISIYGAEKDWKLMMKSLRIQQLLDHSRHYLEYPYAFLQMIFEGTIERSDQMVKKTYEEMTQRKQKWAFMIVGTNHWPSLMDAFREKEMSVVFILPKGGEMNAEESQKSLRPFLPAFTKKAWK